MSQRFFVPTAITERLVTLEGDEGHHLARVMRAKAGDALVLFDGGGAEFDARVTAVARSSVEVEVLARREADREAPVEVTLGVALPKGDRQRFLVEKAVELGVARLAPLVTNRGVAQPTDSALDRLQRAVIEASKQCGRNRLMEVAPPVELSDYVAEAPRDALRFIAHPGGEPLARIAAPLPSRICVAVGPEGGLTQEEIALAHSAGWRSVDLGPRILRVETAAIALAAWSILALAPSDS
jgi:16S rRNA (uracil1498-N3)-methyltransferase